MPAMEGGERCGVLAALFQTIVGDMKENAPAFEDLANKTTKLHSNLRATIASTTVFLEAFQKVADVATNSRGATKEIGKALTRLCLRQRSIESKLKTFTSTLLERLVVPLQETVAEWQKAVVQLDKDHAREYKKARADIKHASSDTVRLQRKAKKGKSDAKERLEGAMQGVSSLYGALEETEKKHVRLALVQERKQFCHFITCVEPIVAAEVSMINEAVHLQEILESLCSLAADPDNLPEASEHVITDTADVKLTTAMSFQQSPPGSPASLVRPSRRSSLSSLSSLASASEADSAIGVSPNHGSSGHKISHGSDGDLLCDQSSLMSLSSKHSSYHSGGGRSSVPGGAAAGDEALDSLSLHAPGAQQQQRSQLERPHTISVATAGSSLVAEMVARQQHSARPALQADTFVPPLPSQPPPPGTSGVPGVAELAYATSHSRTPSPIMLAPPPAAVMMPPPPKPSRSVVRRDTLHGPGAGGAHRNLPPRVIRAKPVALPSVPFMASEPVYMNTQELAARIAEKRHASAELHRQQSLHLQQPQEVTVQAADRKSSSDQPTQKSQHHQKQQQPHAAAMSAAAAALQPNQTSNPCTALANAIKELEASTAALNEACDDAANQPLPPPPDSFILTSQSRASAGEDQLSPLREVSCTKLQPESEGRGTKADQAVDRTDHDAWRIAQGRPVLTSAGPAVLRRTASVKPPPPMRKSSSVTSPRSFDAESVSRGVSPAGSTTSILSEASGGSWIAPEAEALRPGSAGLPAASVSTDGAAAIATTAAVVRRSAEGIRHYGAVSAATAPAGGTVSSSASSAHVITSPAQQAESRGERVGPAAAEAAAAAVLPAAASAAPPTAAIAAPKAAPPVAAKAPPPAVAAKPSVFRRDLVIGGGAGNSLPAPSATASLNGSVASYGAGSAAASPPWERPAAASAVSLPPWERGSSTTAAATVAGSIGAVTAAPAGGQSVQQQRDATSAVPAFGRLGADFVASLGAKLAAGSSNVGGDSIASAEALASAAAPPARHHHPGASPEAAIAAGRENNLVSQIHTGVKLKQTQTDDRSAPRVM